MAAEYSAGAWGMLAAKHVGGAYIYIYAFREHRQHSLDLHHTPGQHMLSMLADRHISANTANTANIGE